MTIKAKLWLVIASSVVGLLLLSAFSLSALHTKLVQEKETQLVKLVDSVFSELNYYQSLEAKNQLSKEEAQAKSLELLKTLRYGSGDYFWVNDNQPTMIMHPINSKLDGTNLSKLADKKGNLMFVNMVEAAKKGGESGGFVNYYWTRPNSDVPVLKLSHVREFKPWGWIVGTGVYVDDIDAAFNLELMEELGVIGIILVIILAFGITVIRSLSGAIQHIVNSVAQVASGMRFNVRLPRRKDELDAISEGMNGLLSALEKGVEEANQVVGAIANADFTQRMQGTYVGDLDLLKTGVNGSANSVSFMMEELEKVMQGLNAGRFDVRMDSNVPQAFRDLVEGALDSINRVVSDINAVMACMNDGDFSAQVNSEANGSLLNMKTNINNSMESLAKAIALINHVVSAQSEGDLTRSLPSDEFGGQLQALMNAINYATVKVKSSIMQAADVSNIVNEAAAQVSQGSSDLSARVQEQAAALEQTSATMNEMAATVQTNTANAHKVAALTGEVQHQAQDGALVMQQTIGAMQSIRESSNKIADIVSIIDSIAFQTNLLALNAAVEAARAGEHGRGFAVVASEVRALAGKSAEAAKDIKGLIQDSVDRVENGTHLAEKSGEMLAGITQSIEQVASMAGQIANASGEQAVGIAQVHQAVSQIDEVTQQNAALVEETTAAALSLSNEAKHLHENMAFFNTGYVAKLAVGEKRKSAVTALPAPPAPVHGEEWSDF